MTTTEPRTDQAHDAFQMIHVGAVQLPAQSSRDAKPIRAATEQEPSFPSDHMLSENHDASVARELSSPPDPAIEVLKSTTQALDLVGADLQILADQINDLETFRIACGNQLEVMTRVGVDADGKQRGFGMPKDSAAVMLQAELVENLKRVEDQAVKLLQKELKRSPLGPWVLNQPGIGYKTMARLLASIGDPYWNERHDRPRLVSELWSYCGYGDPASQRKVKGQVVNWSPEAKMRAFLCIEPTTKMLRKPCYSVKGEDGLVIETIHVEGCSCSPWRRIYDAEKARYKDSLHTLECARCTSKGQPAAPVGSPRKAAHINQIAIRNTTKQMLKALWIEAKRLHDEAS